MAGSEIYRVEIPIIVDDQTEAPLRQAGERVNRFEQQARKTNERIRRDFGRDIEARISLIDKTWPVIRSVQAGLRGLTSKAWSVVVDIKDRVTASIKGIISKVTRLLSHPLALLGVGGGVAAATGFGLKMVMEEQDMVSAFQVMLGSREAAEKRMQELIAFAGQTPYTRQEVWGASRQLEILTGGALATGDELTRIGDIAAGTIQPFEEVATWVGRLYSGLKNGRPIGQAARRLEEMGVFADGGRERLEMLAESGMDISEVWPQVIKEFGRFDGLMLLMSKNLRNILLGTKTFFTENVIKKWGQGLADALQPALMRFREWRSENEETVDAMGRAVEGFGRRIGDALVRYAGRAMDRFSKIMSEPEFEQATFSQKVLMLVERGLEEVSAWLRGPGGQRMLGWIRERLEAAREWMEGPGGEIISNTIKWLGDLMAIGIEEITPVLVPPMVELGKEIAGGLVSGIFEVIQANPLVGMLLGGFIGFKLGGTAGILPGITYAAALWGLPKAFAQLDKIDDKLRELSEIPEIKITLEAQKEMIQRLLPYNLVYDDEGAGRLTDNWERLSIQADNWRKLSGHAAGGILTQPHLGLVAEAGPEALIPLSTRMRGRAMALWEETGRYLGVKPYAAGGFTGVPVAVPAAAGTGGATVNLNFDLAGLVGQVVIDNKEGIDGAVDRITEVIASNLRAVFQNMTK